MIFWLNIGPNLLEKSPLKQRKFEFIIKDFMKLTSGKY